MRRFVAALLLALAIGGLVLWMLRSEAPAERGAPALVEPSSVLRAPSEPEIEAQADSRSIDRVAAASSGMPAASTPEPPSAADRSAVRIVGRCVAAENRVPLGGVRMSLRPENEGGIRAQGLSDADGRFELRASGELLSKKLLIAADGEGRLTAVRIASDLVAGARHELGELELHPGARCFGRVVDPDGRPVAGAEIRYGDVITTDAEGRFRCFEGFARGTLRLPIRATGFLDELFKVELPLEEELVLALRPAPKIEGYTLDERGRPIAGVRVKTARSAPIHERPSDAAGRFAVFDGQGFGKPVELHVLSEFAEPWHSTEAVPWGTRDLIVSLRRTLGFDLEVVDRATGEPVERFAVIQLSRTQRPEEVNLQQPGFHAGGKLRVFPVPSGERRLWVIPEDPRWMPHEREDFVLVPDQPLVLRVTLERRPEMAFFVRDTSGAPIANAEVELLRSPLDRELRLGDRTVIDPTGLLRSKNGECCLLDHGRSDEQGRLVLHGVTDRAQLAPPSGGITPRVHPPLFARARAEGFAPALVRVPFDATVASGGAPTPIVLSAGAVLTGVVQPMSRLGRSGVTLRIQSAESSMPPQEVLQARRANVDRSGSFRFDSLSPGEVELYAEIDNLWTPSPVARATLRNGETTAVELDLSPYVPSRFVVQVQGARKLESVHLWSIVAGEAPRQAPISGMNLLSENGVSPELSVLPGTYELRVAVLHTDRGRLTQRSIALGSVRFDPGETYTLHYEIQLRPLILRLRSADGTPLPVGTKVVVREGSLEHEFRCEEAGVVRCDPGPTTPFSLQVNGVRAPSDGLLEPPAGTQTSELVIELAR